MRQKTGIGLWLTLTVGVFLSVCPTVEAQQYQFTTFDPAGSTYTQPVGINASGLITVQYVDEDGVFHSAALQKGQSALLDVPGAFGTGVSAPNARGQAALGYIGVDFNFHSALYDRGAFEYHPDAPGMDNVSPSAINDSGTIVGIVWNWIDDPIVHAYIFRNGEYTVFDNPASPFPATAAWNVNSRGDMVGDYLAADGTVHGFLRVGTKDQIVYVEVNVPGARLTSPFGINDHGMIVGRYIVGRVVHGFVYQDGSFTTVDVPGARLTAVTGINDRGDIIGNYLGAVDSLWHGFVGTPLH